MKLIEDLKDLDKDLSDYEIKEGQELLPCDKEITMRVSRGEMMYFHSDYTTGVRWAIDRLLEGSGELLYMYMEDGCIVSIDIRVPHQFLTFKSVPRSEKTTISSIF